jgi:hypothetical protein
MVSKIPVKTVPVAFLLVFKGTLKSSQSHLEFREQNKHILFLFPKTRTRKRERRKKQKDRKKEKKK